MEHTWTTRRPALLETGLTLLLYAATVAVSLTLAARRPASLATVSASCAATAIGTLAMAFVMRRRTPYPRRAFLAAAAVLAGTTMAGPWVLGPPEAWVGAGSMLWMQPWYLMVMGWVPGRSSGPCSPSSPWAGRLLIGTAAFLGLMSWAVVWLSQRV